MKAKEYLEIFNKKIGRLTGEEKISRQIQAQESWEILEMFVQETKELLKIRRIQSVSATESLLKEVNNKWQVLCKLHDIFIKEDYIKRMQKEDFVKKLTPKEKNIDENAAAPLNDTMSDIRELQTEATKQRNRLRK
jgi:hypothetical protein